MGTLDVDSPENPSGHAAPKGQACKPKNITVYGALGFAALSLNCLTQRGEAEAEKLLVLALLQAAASCISARRHEHSKPTERPQVSVQVPSPCAQVQGNTATVAVSLGGKTSPWEIHALACWGTCQSIAQVLSALPKGYAKRGVWAALTFPGRSPSLAHSTCSSPAGPCRPSWGHP